MNAVLAYKIIASVNTRGFLLHKPFYCTVEDINLGMILINFAVNYRITGNIEYIEII